MSEKNKWTKDEDKLLEQLSLQDLSLKEIKTHFPERSIYAIAARRRLLNLVQKRNQLPFELLIDCMFLSWFAAFILCDGHITKRGSLQIEISEKDVHLLEAIADYFKINQQRIKPIKSKKKVRLFLKKAITKKVCNLFQISRDKSKGEIVFPSFLGEQQLKAFLIGMLWGDGSLYVKNKSPKRDFAQTPEKFDCPEDDSANQQQFDMTNVNPGKDSYTIKFVSSFSFLQQLLVQIQQWGFAKHLDESSIEIIDCQTEDFDLACLKFSGYDAISFFRFLANGVLNKIPPLERKTKDWLTCSLPEETNQLHVSKRFRKTKCIGWCEKEDQLFQQVARQHPEFTNEQIAQRMIEINCNFPKRTRYSISKRRQYHKIPSTRPGSVQNRLIFRWLEPEDSMILDWIQKKPVHLTQDDLIDLTQQINQLPLNIQRQAIRTSLAIRSRVKFLRNDREASSLFPPRKEK